MEIAIPSYKRSQVLNQKTLPYLLSEGFNASQITIFLANEEERQIYQRDISGFKFVVGQKGICQQRLFIQQYYPLNTKILSLDDDIRKVKLLRPDLTFKTLVEKLFDSVQKEGVSMWGLYPVNNLFFCKDRVIVGNFYIIACCYGYINKQDITEYPLSVESKEDCWYSLKRIQLDGAVLRYDGACPDTTYYAAGGLSETRTLATEESAAREVCKLFPELSKFLVKKNGHAEVKIKRKILKTFLLE